VRRTEKFIDLRSKLEMKAIRPSARTFPTPESVVIDGIERLCEKHSSNRKKNTSDWLENAKSAIDKVAWKTSAIADVILPRGLVQAVSRALPVLVAVRKSCSRSLHLTCQTTCSCIIILPLYLFNTGPTDSDLNLAIVPRIFAAWLSPV